MNKDDDRFTAALRDRPTLNEIISLTHLILHDFKSIEDDIEDDELMDGFYEKTDLEDLLDKLLAQIWIFHYDKGLELAKRYNKNNLQLVDPWHLLEILADIYFQSSSDKYFVFLSKKPFKSYVWYPKLAAFIKKLSSVDVDFRFKMLRRARKNAQKLYEDMIKFVETPNEELRVKVLLNIEIVRWYGDLISAFAENFHDKRIIAEKLDFLQEVAENFGDEDVGNKIAIFAALYHAESELFAEEPEFFPLSENFILENLEMLPPREQEYIENFIESAKALRDIELDLQYIKEHSEEFSLFISAFVIGVENIITLSALFRPMQLDLEEPPEPYGVFESYYSIPWSDFPLYFNIKSSQWQEIAETLSSKELNAGVNKITAACMAYITDIVKEYKIRDVYCFMPKDIDVDFKRLNINEQSGLSKAFREKLAEIIRESLEQKTGLIGIPVVKVPISLEEQMKDFSPDDRFF